MAIEYVGIIHPYLRIAVWILASQEKVVADLGPEVRAEIIVADEIAVVLEIETLRRSEMVDLVTKCSRLDVHRFPDTRHVVDHE